MLLALRAEAAPAPPPVEPPSMDMLLYLAEFGDTQGRFVDPADVARALAPKTPEDDAPRDARAPATDAKEHHPDAPADPSP